MSKGLIPELGGEEERKEGQMKVKLKHTAKEERGIRFFTGVMLKVVGRIYIIHSMENSYVSEQTAEPEASKQFENRKETLHS